MTYRGDFQADSTIVIKFTTVDGSGAPVAPSAAFTASDFAIYKDTSATQKSTTNGITVTSPFDSVVGRHQLVIDTSVDTGDIGFWAEGADYFVEINSAKTVDSQSQTGMEIGSFSINNRYAPAASGSSSAVATSPKIVRQVGDTTPVYFTFPTGSLGNGNFTKTRRINGGISVSLAGTITYLYAIDGKHWYSISYNATDRPASPGVSQYTITDGTDVRVIHLQVVSAGSLDAADVRSAIGMASANLDTQLNDLGVQVTMTPPTANAIADAVWDEAITGHVIAGTFGAKNQKVVPSETLNDYKADVSALATQASINTIDSIVDSILVDTDELQTNQGNWLTADVSGLATAAALVTVDTVVDAIRVDTGTTLPGQLSGLNDLAAADIRAAVGLTAANLDTQLADLPTVAEFNARTLPSADYFVVGDYTAPPTTGDIAAAVWDEPIAGHTTATTFGGKNQRVVPSETLNDYKATGFSTHAAADVWAHGTRTLSAFGFSVTVATNNDKTGYSLSQAFPDNFASLGINASGHVSRVTTVDTVTEFAAGALAYRGDAI